MQKSEILEKINSGIKRGAKAKLANMLKVSPSVVSEWFLGSRNPTEEYVRKIAKMLGVAEDEIQQAFSKSDYFFNSGNIAGRDNNLQGANDSRLALIEKDIEILKKELEILKLKIKK